MTKREQCKVCIIGLGSIGRRHAGNLRRYFTTHDVDGIIDSVSSGNGAYARPVQPGLIDSIYGEGDDIPTDYDIVFITNPTSLHYETLEHFKSHGRNFFIEKPLFDVSRIQQPLPRLEEGQQVYVACPLRYSEVVQYVKSHINVRDVIHVRAICSSYLPEWRSNVDYRKTYSAKQSLGGGVKSDLVHEWDYLCHLFGVPHEISLISGKVSNLEIGVDDIALYIGRYENMTIELHLDLFGRETKRVLEMYTNTGMIKADIANNRIMHTLLEESREDVFTSGRNDMHYSELLHFFDVLSGKAGNPNDMQTAARILKLTEGIVE